MHKRNGNKSFNFMYGFLKWFVSTILARLWGSKLNGGPFLLSCLGGDLLKILVTKVGNFPISVKRIWLKKA